MKTRSFRSLSSLVALLLAGTAHLALAQTPVRVVTWNVHPRSIGGVTPESRINSLVDFAQRHGVDLIAFQEVPRSLIADPVRMAPLEAAAAAAGYEIAIMEREYPAPSTRPPTAQLQNAYMVLYNPNVLRPANVPPNANPAMSFFHPEDFTEGLNQARPPAALTFNVQHAGGATSALHLLTWHNEAGTFARQHVAQLEGVIHDHLVTQQEDWVVMGDFNVQDTTPELESLDEQFEQLAHDAAGIDHIVTNVPLHNVLNDDPSSPIEPRFRSDGRHLALFGELTISAPRP